MAIEIEKKFLVKAGVVVSRFGEGRLMKQGYLSIDPSRTVRVRVVGERGLMTIKGVAKGLSRQEIEFAIDRADAEDLLGLCLPGVIEKTRYRVEHQGLVWEVDDFHGENEGLVIAELELPSEEFEHELPDWVGEEVSGQEAYYNSSLVNRPYRTW